MPDRPTATGIVLAGGRSTRFGGDKLAVAVAGRSLLAHTVTALADVCREIVVVLAPEGPEPVDIAPPPSLRLVRDPSPYPGPLVGLLAGLEVAGEPLVLLVGGDMPALRPELLRCLLRILLRSDADAVVPVRRGRPLPLPSALRLGATLPVARHVVASGERSLRGLFASLRSVELPEADWRPFDPDARSFLDVDRPADLARLRGLLGEPADR
jgi:molybdopterin-guanine dinucleotide biosynthesis protein A